MTPTFQLEMIDYQLYRVIAGGREVGTIQMVSKPSVASYHYENDLINGTKSDISEAAKALYDSKFGG